MALGAEIGFESALTGDSTVSASSLGIALAVTQDIAGLAQDWRALEARGNTTPFQKFDFIEVWLNQVGLEDGIRPCVVSGRDLSGELLFLLPFGLRNRSGIRVLEWLGTGYSNYLAGIYSDDFVGQINRVAFKTLWREITALLPRYDCIDFRNQPEFMGVRPNPFSILGRLPGVDEYYLVTLERDFERFYENRRSSRSRRHQRKLDRKMDGLGAIRFEHETDPVRAGEAVEEVLAGKNRQLHRQGCQEKFPERDRAMIRQMVCGDKATPPSLILFTLRLDDEIVAASINTTHDKTMCGVILYMAKGPLDKLSPGGRLLRMMFEWAGEQGYETFDLSLGRADYKLAWADETCTLFDTRIALNPAGLVYVTWHNFACKVKRWIKKSDRRTALAQFLLSRFAC